LQSWVNFSLYICPKAKAAYVAAAWRYDRLWTYSKNKPSECSSTTIQRICSRL